MLNLALYQCFHVPLQLVQHISCAVVVAGDDLVSALAVVKLSLYSFHPRNHMPPQLRKCADSLVLECDIGCGGQLIGERIVSECTRSPAADSIGASDFESPSWKALLVPPSIPFVMPIETASTCA